MTLEQRIEIKRTFDITYTGENRTVLVTMDNNIADFQQVNSKEIVMIPILTEEGIMSLYVKGKFLVRNVDRVEEILNKEQSVKGHRILGVDGEEVIIKELW